jgi:hypothetical protein
MDAGNGTLFEATATLASGEHADLSKLSFHPGKPVEVAVARGGAPADADVPAPDSLGVVTSAAAPHTHVSTKLGITPRKGDDLIDVDAFSFGFVGDRVGHMNGYQLALGWTEAASGLNGLQMAVGATWVSGDARGLQMASGVTAAQGSFRGLQMGGLATLSAGDLRGLQMGGLGTWARGSMEGLQMGGILTGAQSFKGLQMAGVVALADDVSGVQMSVVNAALNQRGMQLGVVNVVDEGVGFRMGVVNVARKTRGFQFGVVNVAHEDDGESFALFNFIGNGLHDLAFYSSDALMTNLALKLGGRHLYTSLGAGYSPGADSDSGTLLVSRDMARWGYSFGIGWHFPVLAGRLEAVELEANSSNIFRAWSVSGNPPELNALRLTSVVRLAPHISVIAGLAWNVMVGQDKHDLDLSLIGLQSVMHHGETTVRMYPGFLAGLQI